MKLNKIITVCAFSVAMIISAGYAPHAYGDSSLIARGGGDRGRAGGVGEYHGGYEGGYHGAAGYGAHPEADRALYNAGAATGSAGAGNAGNVETPAYVPQPPIIIAPQ